MAEQVVTLTYDQITALADKLDRLGEVLDADERRALVALLYSAAEQASAGSDEVTGFALTTGGTLEISLPDTLTFAMLGDSIRLPVDLATGRVRKLTAGQSG